MKTLITIVVAIVILGIIWFIYSKTSGTPLLGGLGTPSPTADGQPCTKSVANPGCVQFHQQMAGTLNPNAPCPLPNVSATGVMASGICT